MATTGHKNESINVGGLKASLQSLKSTYIDNTVWTTSQSLTVAQKDQAVSNILDKTDTSGMKRIVLKKSDNFKTKVEEQTGGNTIFVIKYDYTLSSNITVPANCILEFDGGSISGNGTGKDTLTGNFDIKSPLVRIFKNCKLSDYNHPLHSKWFCIADGVTDDADNLQCLFDSGVNFIIDEGTHRFTKSLVLSSYIQIYGNSPFSKYTDCCLFFDSNGTPDEALRFNRYETSPYITLKGVHFVGKRNSNNSYGYYNDTKCIVTSQTNVLASCLEVEDCYFENFDCVFYSNSNSYYNSFHRIRCYSFGIVFKGFDPNNFRVTESRISNGKNVFMFDSATGGDGPITIDRNCFEGFHGNLISVLGITIGKLNFTNNYVEVDSANEPASNENYMFYIASNNVRSLYIANNNFQINSVFRFIQASVKDSFISIGNDIRFSLTKTKVNLLYYLTSLPSMSTIIINDNFAESAETAGEGYGAYTKDMSTNAFDIPANCIFSVIDPVRKKLCYPLRKAGATAYRPTDINVIGYEYFDTTLGKPIYWTGVKWVKADGTDA